ncbi:Cytochrome c553 [Methylomagnum ishizawai]|uniref:Cytochrome c553 n=1 Tax=Methylomagnum ishizawai TaxID=1760988 RepID=A0A1Y6D1X7_9GAMM|nr:cytochrome c [Methylomagnum ishizawai]SMF94562.1 Cytochrome c553 [Methylomagnum ishizawai]
MKSFIPRVLTGLALVAGTAHAANPEAGKAKVEAVCAACHGIAGISASPAFPNLAGQKEAYLQAALTAYKDGSRKNPIMGNLAAGLSDTDIADLAAYLSGLKRCE